jgi:hypothetical protein
VGDLDRHSLNKLTPILNDELTRNALEVVIGHNRTAALTDDDLRLYPIGKRLKRIENCSSKEIRKSRQDHLQICDFKIGLALSVAESKTWLNNVRTLTSVKHRNIILRVAHGDIYSNDRCWRFGLSDNPRCPDCGQIETVNHKLFQCPIKRAIWQKVFEKTARLIPGIDTEPDITKAALCSFVNCNQAALTIHAEVLLQILGNRINNDQRLQVHNIINTLIRREGKLSIQCELCDLIED